MSKINSNNHNGSNDSEIHLIQLECSNMISLLKDLQNEENDLQCCLEILAREALLCGFNNDVFEPPIPKKRKTKVKDNKGQ